MILEDIPCNVFDKLLVEAYHKIFSTVDFYWVSAKSFIEVSYRAFEMVFSRSS